MYKMSNVVLIIRTAESLENKISVELNNAFKRLICKFSSLSIFYSPIVFKKTV